MQAQSFARMPEMKIIGVSLKTKYNDMQAAKEIEKLWEMFYEQNIFAKIPNKAIPNRIISLYTDYDKQGNCTLILGSQVLRYEIDTMPSGMVCKTIPAGHYALFSGEGKPKKIVLDLWQAIWADKKLQRTFLHDFELYDTPTDLNNVKVDIYIGVHGKL